MLLNATSDQAIQYLLYQTDMPLLASVAQLDVCPTGDQEVAG